MKAVFYAASKPREIMLANALAAGMKVFGDTLEIRNKGDYGEDVDGNDRRYPGPTDDTDVAVMFGVKGDQIFWDHRALGIPCLYIDKGYTRETAAGHTLYSRMCVNASSPCDYMMATPRDYARVEKLRLKLQPHRPDTGGHIIYASSSQKYHEFHKLGDAHTLAQKVVTRMGKLSGRQIVYRPKPRDKSAKPVQGAMFSTGSQSIVDALRGCHLLVTYGASACFDAIVNGVPTIVLGEGVAKPVASSTEMEGKSLLEHPTFPNDVERGKWLAALAFAQWTVSEIQSGEAWTHLRTEIEKQRHAQNQ